jgi:hypothetical protein
MKGSVAVIKLAYGEKYRTKNAATDKKKRIQ